MANPLFMLEHVDRYFGIRDLLEALYTDMASDSKSWETPHEDYMILDGPIYLISSPSFQCELSHGDCISW